MQSFTINDIVQQVLIISGAYSPDQPAPATAANQTRMMLNLMMADWNSQRWLTYYILDLSYTSTGADTYTIGPGGNFDTGTNDRPDDIEYGYIRLLPEISTSIDLTLYQIPSAENYAQVPNKNLSAIANSFWYQATFPLGTIYPFPLIPPNSYTMHFGIKNALPNNFALTDTIALPAVYINAILWNLASNIGPIFQLDPIPKVEQKALESLRTIRGANSQIPNLTIPPQRWSYRYGSRGGILPWLSGVF